VEFLKSLAAGQGRRGGNEKKKGFQVEIRGSVVAAGAGKEKKNKKNGEREGEPTYLEFQHLPKQPNWERPSTSKGGLRQGQRRVRKID